MDYWFWIRIVIYTAIVAALFVQASRILDIDLIALWKKRKRASGKMTPEQIDKEYIRGFQAGLEQGEERKSASRICEGFNCVNVADETGAMVEHGYQRKIICATCLSTWKETGWTVIFEWGK